MSPASCTVDVLNEGPDGVLLYLEFDGNEFLLPPAGLYNFSYSATGIREVG